MFSDSFKIKIQYVMPKHLLSRIVGKLAAAKLGFVTTSLVKLFAKQYKVDMQEAANEDLSSYASFNEFFTRPLKDGIRPIDSAKESVVFPVDGCISQFGKIENDQLVQAKGHNYSVQALLGGDEELSANFTDGDFMTIYLSPRDYHRIHMPIDGTLEKMIYVPGELFSVNPLTAENVPGLFARNERVVSVFNSDHGKFAMVLVGATIVASIETVWAGNVTPPPGKKVRQWTYPADSDTAVSLAKGQEMGRFKLGSTVVMVYESGMQNFAELENGDVTRLGQVSGQLL